jgi:monoterpene epsilon-lactone hydrolase
MASPQLDSVIRHLRHLAARALEATALPPEKCLATLRQLLNEYANVDPGVLEVVARVQPLLVGNRPCEWLVGEESPPERRLLYLHGGSWTKGGLDSHRALSARLARATRCSVLAIEYRLAPEHPFPAGLEDCIASYLWMREKGPEGPTQASHTFIAGDSAGGNLTLATLLALKERNQPLPTGAIALSPATDFTGSGESMRTRVDADPLLKPEGIALCAAAYLQQGENLRLPLASPLFGDLKGLPPLLLQVGDAEILRDDSCRFADRARAVGVKVELEVWPEMPHVFQAFAPFLPEAREAIAHIGAFVEARCGEHPGVGA